MSACLPRSSEFQRSPSRGIVGMHGRLDSVGTSGVSPGSREATHINAFSCAGSFKIRPYPTLEN